MSCKCSPSCRFVLSAAIAVVLAASVQGQTGRWAKPEEPAAKLMIELEREWALAACTHESIEATILAEDFHGTAPDGSQYDKKEAVSGAAFPATKESECVMYDVKVHLFGDSMAVLYGSESALLTEKDGRKHRRKLTWVDTWLKRDGKWQIVAAEDMPSEMK